MYISTLRISKIHLRWKINILFNNLQDLKVPKKGDSGSRRGSLNPDAGGEGEDQPVVSIYTWNNENLYLWNMNNVQCY